MALSVHHSKSELINMKAKIQIVNKVLSLVTTQPSNQEEGLVNKTEVSRIFILYRWKVREGTPIFPKTH